MILKDLAPQFKKLSGHALSAIQLDQLFTKEIGLQYEKQTQKKYSYRIAEDRLVIQQHHVTCI